MKNAGCSSWLSGLRVGATTLRVETAIRPSSTVCCLESLERLLILLPESQSSQKSICCPHFAFKAPQALFPALTLWPDSEKRTSAVWILWPESQGLQKSVCFFDAAFRRLKHSVKVGICGQTAQTNVCCLDFVARARRPPKEHMLL